ncbi:hypothetical protein DSO57_1004179 [Entomophthora muscae]|uniref:Uncharacterized protein n=1 Tax=Entomophthora muscae TaxID=34485 RepID=A0ACC2UU76_9FUNG|nr:hypothetical protein DSO57_1004179 [Entomophthora muscae]
MIPETRKIECEPIYAADSLTLSQMKVFLMYLYQEYYHPHHLDLLLWFSYPSIMQEPPTIPLAQEAPSTQDFCKIGSVYITVLGLADQAVPHTGSWCP